MIDCVHLSCLYIWYDRHLIHVRHGRHLIVHMTWLYIWSVSDCPIHLYFVCYSVLFQYIFSLSAHILYARAPSPLFFHIHWELWLPRFTYPGFCMLSYWSGIWRGSQTSWETGVLLLDHPFSLFSYFSLFLLLSWLCALSSVLVLSFYSSAIIV